MIVNSSLTVYHKDFDEKKREDVWIKYNYDKVWFYGGKGASTNAGYENANDVKIRIPYDLNQGLNVNNFKIGDILVKGNLDFDIAAQQDLLNYEFYNITSIVNNDFGINKHIHLSGK